MLARLDQSRILILIPSAALNLGVVILGLYIIQLLDYPPGAVLILLLVVLLVGDLAPKLVALTYPSWFFRTFSPAFLVVGKWLEPLASLCCALSAWIEPKIVPANLKRRASYTQEEFEALVALHEEAGILDKSESELITEILKVGDMTASDCMTSRVDAFALSADLEDAELLQRLNGTDWWKVPMYRESPDAIIGVLDVFKALQDKDTPLSESISPPRFIPDTMPALNAFRDYLQLPHSMVVVLDEFGGTAGVLTHEDIVEAMIRPRSDLDEKMVVLGPDRVRVPGTMRIDDVSRQLGVALETEGLDTIGGLIFTRMGRVPAVGDSVDLGPIEAEVTRLGAKRVEEVILVLSPQ